MFGEHPIVAFRAEPDRMRDRFGVSHAKEVDAWVVPSPTDIWAFAFECGLEILIQWTEYIFVAEIASNERDAEHVIVHLGKDFSDLWISPEAQPAGRRREVWRQDDNGQRVMVESFQSARAAQCFLQKLESHKHKQFYWIEAR
jgi:hypothetical protein